LEICKLTEKHYGVGSVYTLDDGRANLNIERWSTGIEQLDKIIGGGMPCGRQVEIFGSESAGKTSLLYHLLAQHEISLDVPIEGTFDVERAKIFGNKKGQLIVRRATTGEQSLEVAREFARAGCPVIGIDSVPAMITEKEFAEENMENCIIEKSGTTLIFINQLRDTMNVMMFGEKDHTPGGRALRHYNSLKIRVTRKEWIQIPNNYDPADTAEKKKVGLIMKCKVVKSKICNPYQECEIPMFFHKGFVSSDDVPAIRKELMEAEREKYLGCKKKKAKKGEKK